MRRPCQPNSGERPTTGSDQQSAQRAAAALASSDHTGKVVKAVAIHGNLPPAGAAGMPDNARAAPS
jgi:hypothetical protein